VWGGNERERSDVGKRGRGMMEELQGRKKRKKQQVKKPWIEGRGRGGKIQ
jgi:hypothetical protein